MLIRLLPAPNQPTILFKLTFGDLSGDIQLPSAWTHQLAALDIDDIEIPKLIHALDKAVGLQCILEEVRFDLVNRIVKCSFVDGESEEWPMEEELECGCPNVEYKGSLGCGLCRRGPTLTERLESVLDDVNESAKETERERKEEEDKTRFLNRGLGQALDVKEDDLVHAAAQSLSLNSPPGPFSHPVVQTLPVHLVH
ncbi:hypothetical protein L218DRAFT_155254 [Marasmius fiardii PR-910]|nr:hypothetical protein L218DRAFT_155254 [Marasmius fiardii PR-910]